MYTPVGFFAPQGGGGNLIPISGYSLYLDMQDSPRTVVSGKLQDITDLSTAGYIFSQSDSSLRPYFNEVNGFVSGSNGGANWYLDCENANDILTNRHPNTNGNDFSFVIGTNAAFNSDNYAAAFEMGTNTGGLGSDRYRFSFNFNEGGTAQMVAMFFYYEMRQFSVTNDLSKGYLGFMNSPGGNSTKYFYQRGSTETTAPTETGQWISDSSWYQITRLGNRSRSNMPSRTPELSRGFQANIYFVAVYPFQLTSQDRQDIADWFTAKWGLSL